MEERVRKVYELRRSGQLNDALDLAVSLLKENYNNDEYKKASAWVYIDLCKKDIANNELDRAQECYYFLNNFHFDDEDEFVDSIRIQIQILKHKIETSYPEVQKAEELSKNGNNKEALAIFKNIISQNKLHDIIHESYGWVIYRFIKAEESNLSSIEVKTFLRDYLNLKNERPSMLHSLILIFALNYSKTHNDFKFYNFFIFWNPHNLRYEDLHDGYKDGEVIPSLISCICRELVNSNAEFSIEEFLIKIALSNGTVLEFFRETFYWNIYRAHSENRFYELWNLFEQYNNNYSKYGQSKWHSKILNLAERYMKENDEWRFLNFFKNWNPENLLTEDWKEIKKDDHTYKPLAIRAIKKTYEVLKNEIPEQNLSWIIEPYEKAIKLFPDDKWLLREKAIIHFKNNELELAIEMYKQLVLELADIHYVWHEFSRCIVSDNSLKIGILSKAMSLEKNEDFLGDIHLDLAKVLIDENLLENALVELDAYKRHREIKGWKLSTIFDELQQKACSVKQRLDDNWELYKKYIPLAENFAYADFDWKLVVLVDKWDDKGKEHLTFTDGKTIEFAIGKNHFEVLRHSELGQIFKFKLHKQEIKKEVEAKFPKVIKTIITEFKYIPLVVEKTENELWGILEDTYAVVDYINKEKNIIHVITNDNKDAFFPQIKSELQIGDFLRSKIYTKNVKDNERTVLLQIKKVEINSAISKFQTQVAIVDGVNEQKQLFHFVISYKLQGIVKFTETTLRPNEGDFVKLIFATKTDKHNNQQVKVLSIELTEETNTNLRKEITGIMVMKYRNYDVDSPDYAFIENCYVPKHLLEKHNIIDICRVNATAICTGDKWKVIKIEKI